VFYWQETQFGLKPTIRISHLVIAPGQDETVVASKMLYATHYFWTALEFRTLMPDPSRGQGFWLVTINRSRSDGLSGFTGFFVRRRARSEIKAGTRAVLEGTKQLLEAR
jgi:predicted DCC family thiol-disulfide oxidoreductase YuxK